MAHLRIEFRDFKPTSEMAEYLAKIACEFDYRITLQGWNRFVILNPSQPARDHVVSVVRKLKPPQVGYCANTARLLEQFKHWQTLPT